MQADWPTCTRFPRPTPRADPPPVVRSRLMRFLVLAVVALLAAGCVATPDGGAGGPGKEKRSPAPSAGSSGLTAIPPGLVGKAWVADVEPYGHWVAGRLGKPGRIEIDGQEHPIAAHDDWLVSATWAADGSTTLRVRDLASGQLTREIGRPETVVAGVIIGDELVPGVNLASGSPDDPGLVSISLTDAAVRQLIPPGPLPEGWTGDVSRTVAASPTGRSVVSGLCGLGHCAADIVDLATLETHRVFGDTSDLYVGPSADSVVLAGSADSSRLVAFDASSGRQLWARDNAEFQNRYVTTDGRLVLSYIDRATDVFRVSVIDPQSNAERMLLERDPNEDLALWPEFSTDTTAAIGIGGPLEASADQRPVTPVRLLDLATGDFGSRVFAFRIDQ